MLRKSNFNPRLQKMLKRGKAKISLLQQGVNLKGAKLLIIDNDGKARKVVKIRKANTNA